MNEKSIRFGWVFCCSVVLVGSCFAYPLYESSKSFPPFFSYIGTVITCLAFLVAVGEVWVAILRTKYIQIESLKLLNEARRVDAAADVSECLAIIDAVTRNIVDEHYLAASFNIQSFRKSCVRVAPGIVIDKKIIDRLDDPNVAKSQFPPELDDIGRLEYMLSAAARSTSPQKLSKKQRNEMTHVMLMFKQGIEKLSPLRGL